MSLMGVIDCGAHDVSNNKIFSATHTSCTTGLSLRSGQLAEKLFLAVRKMLTIVDLIKVIHLEVRLEYLG